MARMSDDERRHGWRSGQRWLLVLITLLAVMALVGTVIIGYIVDRAQCRASAQAIRNIRTMWEYAIEQNPGPEADQFEIVLNDRIPPAHCEGGKLVVDRSPADTVPAG